MQQNKDIHCQQIQWWWYILNADLRGCHDDHWSVFMPVYSPLMNLLGVWDGTQPFGITIVLIFTTALCCTGWTWGQWWSIIYYYYYFSCHFIVLRLHYTIYSDIKQREAENPHNWEVRSSLVFVLRRDLALSRSFLLLSARLQAAEPQETAQLQPTVG